MRYMRSQINLTALLLFTLVAYNLTQLINETTGTEVDVPFVSGESTITAVPIMLTAILVWMHILMLRGGVPDSKLLFSAEGKREMLWRLSDTPGLEHRGWPGHLVEVGVRVAYGAGLAVMVVLFWYGVRNDLPNTHLLTVFGVGTAVVSALLLLIRLFFERWAKAHPEEVERVLNTPQAQARLEQASEKKAHLTTSTGESGSRK